MVAVYWDTNLVKSVKVEDLQLRIGAKCVVLVNMGKMVYAYPVLAAIGHTLVNHCVQQVATHTAEMIQIIVVKHVQMVTTILMRAQVVYNVQMVGSKHKS
jgi:hypothetical protein